MAAPNLEVRGAYSLGYTLLKNSKSYVDGNIVYTCAITAKAETKYEQGSTGVFQRNGQPALSVALIYTDGNAFKSSEWTGPEVGAAIKVALDTVEANIKNTYGTGA